MMINIDRLDALRPITNINCCGVPAWGEGGKATLVRRPDGAPTPRKPEARDRVVVLMNRDRRIVSLWCYEKDYDKLVASGPPPSPAAGKGSNAPPKR
jgi:hypothetical protein